MKVRMDQALMGIRHLRISGITALIWARSFWQAMGYLYHYRIYLKKYLPAVFAVFAGMQLLFLCVVLPHISKSMVAAEVYWPFGMHKSFDDPMRCRVYLMGVLVCCLAFLVMFFCLYRGKRILPVAVLLALLVYQYAYNGMYYDGANMERYSEKAKAGCELVLGMEEAGYELPEELYLTGYRMSQSQKPPLHLSVPFEPAQAAARRTGGIRGGGCGILRKAEL